MFEVQKSAPPLPPAKPYRARKYPLDTMEVGDWFFVPNKTTESLGSHVHTTGKKLGRKFSLAKGMNGNGVHGVVVTRTE